MMLTRSAPPSPNPPSRGGIFGLSESLLGKRLPGGKRLGRALTLGLAVLLLSACVSSRGDEGGRGQDEPGSEETLSQAACERSCQRAYDVCGDSSAARRSEGSLFGASSGCERQYRACLPRCRQPKRPAKEQKSPGG